MAIHSERNWSIEAIDVEHSYTATVKALKGVTLRIGRGEFVAIIGRNGSGKTTLAKHFNGLLHPTNRGGRVVLGERISTRDAPLNRLSSIVGYVFQNPDRQIIHDTCR